MKFHLLTETDRLHFQPGIVEIEQSATYPLGNDFFQIDHGSDYFAFFDRLGELNYHIAIDQETVAAVGAGILRQVPYHQGEASRPAWYLCDLKVHPSYQRRRLSIRLLNQALVTQVRRCAHGYAISMNPSDLNPSGDRLFSRSSNPLVRVLEKFAPIQFHWTTTLGIYSLSTDEMHRLAPLIIEHRGSLSYLSLQGKKELRLQSNGQVLPLLHVQWGTAITSEILMPQTGYTHMFCVPAEDELAIALAARGIIPQAAASVISAGMESDWRFVLTSDV